MININTVNVILAKLGSYGIDTYKSRNYYLAFRRNCKTPSLGRKLDPRLCLIGDSEYDVEININKTPNGQYDAYNISVNKWKSYEYDLNLMYMGGTVEEFLAHINIIFNNPKQLQQ